MSQFIVVRAEEAPAVAKGMLVRPVTEPTAAEIAEDVLQGKRSQLYEVVSDVTGDADALVDDLSNRIEAGQDGESSPLLTFLRDQVERRRAFACWYGVDASDLPTVNDWSDLEELVVDCARRQPPEVYVRFFPADGNTER